jgi:hypothetical protein
VSSKATAPDTLGGFNAAFAINSLEHTESCARFDLIERHVTDVRVQVPAQIQAMRNYVESGRKAAFHIGEAAKGRSYTVENTVK